MTMQTRRTFLKTALRTAVAALLGLGTGALVFRKAGERCTGDSLCDACPTLRACRLPQALSVKVERGAASDKSGTRNDI